MGHRKSELRFRIENEYKSRIRFIKLTEELLDKKLVQYTFRNQIDIRLLMIGKYIIPQLKWSNDKYFSGQQFLKYKHFDIYFYEQMIDSLASIESLARETLRGRTHF